MTLNVCPRFKIRFLLNYSILIQNILCAVQYTQQKRRLFQFKHLNALASGQGAGLYSNRAEQNSRNPLPDNTHGNFIFRRKCDIFNTLWILHRHTLVDGVKTNTLQRQKEKLSHEWKSNFSKREQKCWPMIFQLCPIRVLGYRQKRDTQGHLPNNLFVTHLKWIRCWADSGEYTNQIFENIINITTKDMCWNTCWSTPTASSPSYIISTQPSLEARTKRDIKACKKQMIKVDKKKSFTSVVPFECENGIET